MGTNYTTYAQFNKATVTVSSSGELNSAIKSLASSGGGTIKVNPKGGPYDLNAWGVGSSKSPILIESSGSGEPVFKSLTIKKSEFLTIKGIKVDTSNLTSRKSWEDDLRIENSNNIEVVDSTFIGSGKGYLSEATSTDVRGTTGAYVTRSEDINFSGNSFSNYMYTVQFRDIKTMKFVENEVTQWQADAFHAGGIQNAEISDNYLHNPLGSTQTLAHTDFIQIRMANTGLDNRNIEIARNIMDSEGGPAAQGIHMGNAGSSGTSYNVSIHDNLIHTAMPRGIGVDKVNGLDIYNNTLLWNKASYIEKTPGAPLKSWDPRILVGGGQNVNLENNVASWMRINGQHQDDAGYQIQYNKPAKANHVDKHVVNLDGSGDPDSYNLKFIKGSPIYGKMGAAISSNGVTAPKSSFDGQTPPPKPAPVVEDPAPVDDTPDPVSGGGSGNSGGGDVSDYGPKVTLRLINTKSDKTIGRIEDGDSLKASYLDNKALSIVADVAGRVGSVKMTLGDHTQLENAKHYALFGNNKANYFAPDEAPFPDAGNYGLKIEIFKGKNGVNKIGESNFEFAVGAPFSKAATSKIVLNGSVVETSEEDEAPLVGEDAVPEVQIKEVPAGEVQSAQSEAPAEGEDGGVLSDLLDMVLGLFGGGSDDAPATAEAKVVATSAAPEVSLEDVVPVTEWVSESTVPEETNAEGEEDVQYAA